jgi:hypothetical protein
LGKQEVGIWWVQKRFPRYGVPIWSLWPNIRFLPSIVAEKNVTKNEHICSMCIKINKVGKQVDPSDSYFLFADFVDFYTHWTYILYMPIFNRIFLSNYWQISTINSCWEKCDEKCAYMFNVYKNQLSRQTGSRNLTGPKTLPTIWYTYIAILWEAFLDPSDSYFLFADLIGFYTHWTYMHIFRHIFLSNYWWSKNASHDMGYLYEACDQISDLCHQ